MAGGYTGTPADFAAAHANVNETKADLDSNLGMIRGAVAETQGGWQGQAASAFNNLMMAFDEKGRKLNEALQNISDMLQQSGVKYDTAEQEHSSAVSNITAGLEG